ncbi:hypothetical protein OG864_23075 [Streptomyces sp. NBC_00124]|uniref:hypothetical protein n=1 Tax=Streptomyces sp. NBC_00124 TaxID=2975662 RepID=UPI00224F0A04|nr:hypothetical protein [Streptomyces sp. NBC_00124]MCX5361595.1 hypothetical protein [Streptomyces sp. NBC_00124]
MITPDINDCQICGAPAPLVPGRCEEVVGYRLMRNPWSETPAFLDGNLHFSCLENSDKGPDFFLEFTRMVQAGHEEIESLDGSLPPLTRMGLGMTQIFSGPECVILQSGVSDRWMVVKRTGPWFRLGKEDLPTLARRGVVRSPAAVIPYRLPVDLGSDVRGYGLPEVLAALGVADRYAPASELDDVEYEFVDYHSSKRLLEYVVGAPLTLPEEARSFLADHVKSYVPVTFGEEGEEA